MTKNINFDDPEVKKVLRDVVQNNRSDPFTLDRVIAHLKSGVLDLKDLRKKPK